mmetsp:Transcript_6681/g.10569  ORF Transcript_6681/g.10569 Transcript_6681/m.10569 type:complete len:329 (+) Transcript_6681:62-1048(+)
MSRCLSRIGCSFKRSLIPRHNRFQISLTLRSTRRITDRSFRLANVGDLAVAQEFKDNVPPEHFVTFHHTSDIVERDLEKQVVIDLSHEQGYKRGHISGALNLPLEKFDFCRLVDTIGGITQDEIYGVFRDMGVGNDTSEIILYDNSGLLACRLWFVLRYFGFQNVRILNGGWRAWLRAGLPVDEKTTVPTPAKSLDLKPKRDHIVTKPSQMMFDHEHETSQIIDTRRSDAFQTYHIPRAINVPVKSLMQDGEFATVKDIHDLLADKGVNTEDRNTIIYSSKGLTSSVGYFCFTMAGLDAVSVYDQGIYNWVSNTENKLPQDVEDQLRR